MAEISSQDFQREMEGPGRNPRAVTDGAIVLEMANSESFIDPRSKLALRAEDLEAIGISLENNRQEIAQCLQRWIDQSDGSGLLGPRDWDARYRQRISRERVVYLEDWKNPSKAFREALRQTLSFCEGDWKTNPKARFKVAKGFLRQSFRDLMGLFSILFGPRRSHEKE